MKRNGSKASQSTKIDSIKAGIYLRVSTQEQADSGLGLASQEYRTKAQCDAKGWTDITMYADEGISGTKDESKRPGLKRLMDDVKAGMINTVVVLSLDRLGRSTSIVLRLIETIAQYNASFVSVKEGFDTSTAQGKFVLTMFAALGQLERDLISERTVDALEQRDRDHGYRSGKLPYGYRRIVNRDSTDKIISEQIVVEADEAITIREMFSLKDSGMSLRKIAEAIQSNRNTQRGGKWQHTAIKVILENAEYYQGKVRNFPAILAQ